MSGPRLAAAAALAAALTAPAAARADGWFLGLDAGAIHVAGGGDLYETGTGRALVAGVRRGAGAVEIGVLGGWRLPHRYGALRGAATAGDVTTVTLVVRAGVPLGGLTADVTGGLAWAEVPMVAPLDDAEGLDVVPRTGLGASFGIGASLPFEGGALVADVRALVLYWDAPYDRVVVTGARPDGGVAYEVSTESLRPVPVTATIGVRVEL